MVGTAQGRLCPPYGVAARAALIDHDARVAAAVALDQRIQRRGMMWMQPHAAVRGGAAEPRQLIGAVNGKAVIEEDRMRHRRIVIFRSEERRVGKECRFRW